jgi:hypothetical protein
MVPGVRGALYENQFQNVRKNGLAMSEESKVDKPHAQCKDYDDSVFVPNSNPGGVYELASASRG